MQTSETPGPPYGCAPDYRGPELVSLIRSDRRGRYRRASVDLRTGQIQTDESGRPLFDEAIYSTRHHLSLAGKGFVLVAVVETDRDEAIEEAQ